MTAQSTVNQAQNRPDRTFRIITIGLLCLGIFFLVLAVQSTFELLQLRLFGVEASGIVVRQEIEEQSVERYEDGKEYKEYFDSYHAVVSFRTSQGTFTIRSYDGGRNAPLYPTESQVTVVYPPRNPEKARIQQEISGFHGIFGPLILIVFGAVLVGASRLMTYISKQVDF
jgi:hypothetical protein